MSETRTRLTVRDARMVMVMAALGALLILVASAILNWPVGVGSEIGGPGKIASAPRAVFSAAAGTCLNWTELDASDTRQVTCDEPHLFEVAGTSDLRAEFGDRATFPSADQWQRLKQERCANVSQRYLRGRLDPNGRLGVGAFTPSEHGWASGDRTLHCGVQEPGPSGKLYRFKGRAAQIDQSNIYSTGRCLGMNGTAVWDPIDCARQHAVEITGVVDLAQPFPDRYPDEAAQDQFLSLRCGELTAQYAGSPTAARDKGLVIYWDTLVQESWNAGSRQVNCKVSAQLPDRSGLAPVTGSVRGEVRVDTAPPGSTATAEPGVPAEGSR